MQGVLATVGDCIGPDEPVHVPMIPAWISLGDHDNILYYRNLGHLYPQKKRSGSHVRLPVLMSDWTTGCSDVSIGRCETA